MCSTFSLHSLSHMHSVLHSIRPLCALHVQILLKYLILKIGSEKLCIKYLFSIAIHTPTDTFIVWACLTTSLIQLQMMFSNQVPGKFFNRQYEANEFIEIGEHTQRNLCSLKWQCGNNMAQVCKELFFCANLPVQKAALMWNSIEIFVKFEIDLNTIPAIDTFFIKKDIMSTGTESAFTSSWKMLMMLLRPLYNIHIQIHRWWCIELHFHSAKCWIMQSS